jgi:biotin carboxyl carrier protein
MPLSGPRPTAAQLRAVLGGRGAAKPVAAAAPAAATKPRAPGPAPVRPAAPSASAPIESDGLELVAPNGSSLQLRVRTELGKAVMRRFGPDGEFWGDRQCVLERGSGRHWVVSPIPGTVNETLVNGETLTSPRTLRQGDQIAVGRAARGIVKLPLRARAH